MTFNHFPGRPFDSSLRGVPGRANQMLGDFNATLASDRAKRRNPQQPSADKKGCTLQAAKVVLAHITARTVELLKGSKALKSGNLAEAQTVLDGIKRRTAAVQSRHRRTFDGIVLKIKR